MKEGESALIIGLCITGQETAHVFWQSHEIRPVAREFRSIAHEASDGRVR